MAGKSTISITFKIDGDDTGFKKLTEDADGLKKTIASTLSEAQKLNPRVINFAALATGIHAAKEAFSQLSESMNELGNAFGVQEGAEKKLETVMKRRMAATDAEIQSIKDLASAQQGLGIIGDEVQLSGAQQMATFLNEKKSIETLLPAMNNLLAQQKDFGATAGDAVSVGNLIGKVMQGEVSALKEVGITFSEAEQKVLLFGNESERATMLAQVITNNVGEMNAALAATDSGKQQQLVNTLGDYKEVAGSIVSGALPFVTIAAQTTTAVSGIATLVAGIKTLSATLYANTRAFAVSAAAMVKNKVVMLATAVAQKTVAAATVAWTAVQKVLNFVLSANPIGFVIMVIGALVTGLVQAYNQSEDFRRICNQVWAAIKPLATALMNGLVKALEWVAEKCRVAWNWLKKVLGLSGQSATVTVDVKPKKDTSMDLGKLEDKYSSFDLNGKKSQVPSVKVPTVKSTEESESNGLIARLEKKIADARKRLTDAPSEEAIATINKEIEAYESQLDVYRGLGKKVAEEVEAGIEDNGPIWKEDASTLADITNNIRILNDQLQSASVDEAGMINKQIALWNQKADAIRNAGKEQVKQTVTAKEALGQQWGALKNVGGSIESITNALKGNGNAWRMVTGIVDGFISLTDGIKKFVGAVRLLTQATNLQAVAEQGKATATTNTAATDTAATAIQVANSAAKTTASATEAAADTTAATAKVFKAHAWMPFVGIGIAAAMIGAMMASIKSAKSAVPKFANGGIAFGPTLGLFGEYAGASHNPEVVAPLDKLRGMIADTSGGSLEGRVKFEIEGRTLVGILSRETNLKRRS